MSSDIHKILEDEYNLGTIQSIARLKSGVSNENYKVVTDTGQCILRVCRFEPQNQIKTMIPFLEYAEMIGYPAPRLIRTKTGAAYFGPETKPIIVTSLVDGQPGTHKSINDDKLASLGAALADFHKINWSPQLPSATTNTTYILGVYSQFVGADFLLSNETSQFLKTLAEEYEHFKSSDTQAALNALPQGLIHNDVIPANVLFKDDRVIAFVDLEEVGRDIMLLDIARVLNSWCCVDHQPVESRFVAFLTSYHARRPFTAEEIRMIPEAMRFISFRNSVYGLKMLAENRINEVADIESYGHLKFIRHNQDGVNELVRAVLV